MIKKLYGLGVLSVTLMVSGCAMTGTKVVSNVSNYKTAINFAQKGTLELSAVMDNKLFARNDRLSIEGEFNVFETDFFPTHGLSAITNSFSSFCSSMKGEMIQGFQAKYALTVKTGPAVNNSKKNTEMYGGLCLKAGDKKNALFYYNIPKIVHSYGTDGKSSTKYTIKVKEPINGESEQLVLMEGYVPAQNKLESFKSIEREKLAHFIKTTQKEVKLKGTKICKGLPIAVMGYTEDFANGKIKIMSDNKFFWDTPKNWYACEL